MPLGAAHRARPRHAPPIRPERQNWPHSSGIFRATPKPHGRARSWATSLSNATSRQRSSTRRAVRPAASSRKGSGGARLVQRVGMEQS